MDRNHLVYLQRLPLDVKIRKSILRIITWYEHNQGNVYVSWSGGKDSTVLLHLVRQLYSDVPAVFVNTFLEFPSIRRFVNLDKNKIILTPKKRFETIIEEYGYPVVSKKVSRMIYDLQNPSETNAASRKLYLTGFNKDNNYYPAYKLPNKWVYLIDAGFKISNKCCYFLKHQPIHEFEKRTQLKAYVGTMAAESTFRAEQYMKNGCNNFKSSTGISTPLGFWTEQDILEYIYRYRLPIAECYGKVLIDLNGQYYTTGEKRTGCMYCLYGCHLEKGINRIQRLALDYPKQYNYCINKLGYDRVLSYLDIPYRVFDNNIYEGKRGQMVFNLSS